MGFNDEIATINSLDDYHLIKYLESGLISRATGGNFDDYDYVRQKVLTTSNFQTLLPNWVRTCRDTNQFWNFIKGKFGSYQERREFIWSEFEPLLNHIEFKTFSPLDETIAFDEKHIHQQWQKAIERKDSDPEGAITMSRTLLESLLKHILDEQKINHGDNM